MKRREAADRDERGHLRAADEPGGEMDRGFALGDQQQRESDGEQENEPAERHAGSGVESATKQKREAPAEAADQGADAEPGPALVTRQGAQAAHRQRQIGSKQRDVGLGRSDQGRRGKAADEPEQRARRPETKRQKAGEQCHHRHAQECGERADHSVDVRGHEDRRV